MYKFLVLEDAGLSFFLEIWENQRFFSFWKNQEIISEIGLITGKLKRSRMSSYLKQIMCSFILLCLMSFK